MTNSIAPRRRYVSSNFGKLRYANSTIDKLKHENQLLRDENERMRTALREILDVASPMTAKNARAIVKEALGDD